MKISKSQLIMYILTIIYTLLSIFLKINNVPYFNYFNPFIWLLLFSYAFYITKSEYRRIRGKTEKAQTVLVNVLFYLVVYYLSGIAFGYAASPYSHELLAVIKNIWIFIVVIICEEFIRALLIDEKKHWYTYILVTLIFIVADINFYHFFDNFLDFETSFKYICSILIPTVLNNVLYTYLVAVGGYEASLCYRIPIILTKLLIPLFPDFVWIWPAIVEVFLALVVFIQVNYVHVKKTERRDSRKKIKKQKFIRYVPGLTILAVIVCFLLGMFKYMPISIVSNSMAKLIKRGDVVIVKNLTQKEINSLQVNDIVVYNLDGSMVSHRIIDIKKVDGNKLNFITKGDNNNAPDAFPVAESQVKGKVILKIPKLGYPSVYVYELINNSKKPNVETGKE